MLRKFKHYATDEIIEKEIKNGLVEFNNVKYKLVEFDNDIIVDTTSWILIKND